MCVNNKKIRSLIFFFFAIGLSACDSQTEQSSPSDSHQQKPKIDKSKWSLSEDKDPITDEISRHAILLSNESDRLFLALICQKNFNTDSIVFQSGEYSRFEVADVIYRIDQAEPVQETWFVNSTVYSRAYDGKEYIDDLYGKLEGAHKLTIRTQPMDPEDRSVTLSFDIYGIEQARQYILGAGACAEGSP